MILAQHQNTIRECIIPVSTLRGMGCGKQAADVGAVSTSRLSNSAKVRDCAQFLQQWLQAHACQADELHQARHSRIQTRQGIGSNGRHDGQDALGGLLRRFFPAHIFP